MHIVKQIRLKRKWTLRRVCGATGIPLSTLWKIEKGLCLPEPTAAKKLRELLELPGLPDSSQVLPPSTLQGARPFDRPRINQIYWQRLRAVYGQKMRHLRVPAHVLEWMKECLPSDSPVECLALCTLASAGAVGQFSNPHTLGYRQQCILDHDGLALADRLLPGLQWQVDGLLVLIWPQVQILTAQGTFRLDLLVAVDGHWLVVEINGKTHTQESDQYRDQALGCTALRISNDDVRKLRFAQLLRQEIVKKREVAP